MRVKPTRANGRLRPRHAILAFKIVTSIALVEFAIMLAFSATSAEERLGSLGASLADTFLLSLGASVIIFFWAVRPMRIMKGYIEVKDALIEQVHATALSAEVGAALTKNVDLRVILRLCTEAMVRHLGAAFARIWTIDAKGEVLELQASAGMYTHTNGAHGRIPVGAFKIGLIAEERKPHLTNVVIGDQRIGDQAWAKQNNMVAFAGYPLIVGETLVGVMGMFARKRLGDATLLALASVADGIAVGIERKRAEAKAQYLAYHDPLTGLPNFHFFREFLRASIEGGKRYKKRFALVFVDIDGFKRINDTLGHESGDLLLRTVAIRLLDAVRSSDLASRPPREETAEVVRLGGDEFVVLLKELRDVQDAGRIAWRMLSALAQPCRLGEHEVFVTASSGISVFPDDGDDVESLLKNTDTALHFAKERGTNQFHYYSKSMNAAAMEILILDSELHHAVERGEFLVHYQPKVDIASRRLAGAEALVRWTHPQKGLVMPSIFIPRAEASGLIVPIGLFVLREVCRQMKEWQAAGIGEIRVAANLSSRQFDQQDLLDTIRAALDLAGISGQSLEIEITESALMRNPDQAIRTLHELKELGIQITIDDFGTGYSSLNYLRHLPLDAVKIDMSFVHNVLASAKDAAIVEAIIDLSHALRLKVIAEGVESEEQAAFLMNRGCDQMQSFLSGRPVPGAEFAGRHLGRS